MSATKTADEIIKALGVEFPKHVIRMKPGSNKRPAMPYVSHGSVTKRLNDICPGWSSRVVEMHTFINGNGAMVCAGVTLELTIPGLGSRQEFGTAAQPRDFGTDAKNAMSDALKRCAMRYGVALDLWESADEDDEDADAMPYQKGAEGVGPPASAYRTQQPAQRPAPPARTTPPAAQPVAVEPLSAVAFKNLIERVWTQMEDGATLAAIKDTLEAYRPGMNPAQKKEVRDQLVALETSITERDALPAAAALAPPVPRPASYAG